MSTALAVEYDPRVDGARCDDCILRELRSGRPVRGEFHGSCDEALVIAESPGDEEIEAGRPLVGKSGHELMAGLNSIGVTRTQIALTNAILCQPPNGELDKVLLKLQRENKVRAARGEQALPTPMEACRPRLMREVRGFENLIPLGKIGLQTITGSNRKIMDARGGGIEGIIDTFDGFTTLEREAGSTKVIVIDPKPGDHRVKILPTVHPSFVTRRRQWTSAFRADLGRAFRWFRGALAWVPPRMTFNPSAAELLAFLSRPMRVATPLGDLYGFECDVETTGRPGRKEEAKEPLLAVLRCLGASTLDEGVCCSFQGIDGMTRYYPQDEEMRVVAVWLWFFLHPDLIKFGWNWGYYDRQTIELPGWIWATGSLETAATIDPAALADPHHPFWLQLAERGWGHHRRFGVTPKPILDGIMVHRVVEPGMPHGLGYVGSVNTDVTNWKADHTSTDPKSDQALWIYNITDCAVGARAKPALLAAAHQRNQLHLVPFGHRIQSLCVGLHRNGMRINQDTRKRAEVWLRNATAMYRDEVRKLAGDDGLAVAAKPKKKTDLKAFNPASSHQVKALLFEKWGLTPTEYTKLGDPSTGDDALRALIFDPLVPEAQKKAIKAVRKFRGTAKELGTYILPFRMSDEPVNDYDEGLAIYDETSFKDDWERRRRSANDVDDPEEAPRGGLCLVEDGRIHPDYNAHTAITFRLSSSRPNGQNIPYWIRCLIEAAPGHSIVGADEDQLELRVIADMANLDLYLEIFNYKLRNPTCEQCIKCDPHSLTADVMFQDAWRTASKAQKKKLRDLSKRIKYASFYGSGDETVHGIVTEVEDEQGNFTYAHLTIRELALVRRKWLKQFPGLQTWWDATEEECRQNGGFLADPILGVRRDFLNGDDEDYNEKINFKVQTAGALIVHKATEKVLEVVPFGKWGHGTGLIQQGHDALLAEVPDAEVENVEAIFENDMSLTVPQFPNVVFSVKPKSGKTWYEAA